MLHCNHLFFNYPQEENTLLLNDITFTLFPGERWTCIGASGAGKSTLLLLLAGLLKDEQRKITFKEKPVEAPLDGVSVLLQSHSLFPWKKVKENILLPLHCMKKRNKGKEQATLQKLLQQLNLSHMVNKSIQELSGGEKQRVALARALITRPELLFLDEPFSALDELTKEQLNQLLLQLSEAYQMAYFMITHSLKDALLLGEKIFLLQQGKGTIYTNPFFKKNPLLLSEQEQQNYVTFCQQLHNSLGGTNAQ